MLGQRHHMEVVLDGEEERKQKVEIQKQIKRAQRDASEPPPTINGRPLLQEASSLKLINIDIPVGQSAAHQDFLNYNSKAPTAHFVVPEETAEDFSYMKSTVTH